MIAHQSVYLVSVEIFTQADSALLVGPLVFRYGGHVLWRSSLALPLESVVVLSSSEFHLLHMVILGIPYSLQTVPEVLSWGCLLFVLVIPCFRKDVNSVPRWWWLVPGVRHESRVPCSEGFLLSHVLYHVESVPVPGSFRLFQWFSRFPCESFRCNGWVHLCNLVVIVGCVVWVSKERWYEVSSFIGLSLPVVRWRPVMSVMWYFHWRIGFSLYSCTLS